MKKLSILLAGIAMLPMTSCIQEFEPQSGSVTQNQATQAPNSYNNFVNALTSNINGKFVFNSNRQANDFGYSALYLMRDVMGNDMVPINNNWFSTWYQCGVGLAPIYLNCQYPLTFYYGQIKACNTVIKLSASNLDADQFKWGAGQARCLRAMWYLDIAQMFSEQTYAANSQAPTVPIVTDDLDLSQATQNPRATNEEVFKFILEDLDEAENLLDNFTRANKFSPDKSVVYGLKARAYLLMEDWANAKKYAQLAQTGYSMLTEEQYTDRNNGFNNVNSQNSWMMAMTFKANDATITYNDGDNSWGTWMICEFPAGSPTDLGYYNNYGGANYMDRHLYETIPATDFRKKCFVDFALDEMQTKEEIVEALSAYSDVPEYVYATGAVQGAYGGMPLKYRSKDGNHETNQVGWCVDLPIMRVEEMVLIEAEATGMINESEGIDLLTKFAKTRDAEYVYGTHNEAYNNPATSPFRNEVWWQRRAEFWGEGIATLDIKRLQKGIIRSYAGTNHVEGYRWNSNSVPQWMTYCFVQTESNYNDALINNPTPIAPTGDSPEYSW